MKKIYTAQEVINHWEERIETMFAPSGDTLMVNRLRLYIRMVKYYYPDLDVAMPDEMEEVIWKEVLEVPTAVFEVI